MTATRIINTISKTSRTYCSYSLARRSAVVFRPSRPGWSRCLMSTEAAPVTAPTADDADKVYPDRVISLVDQISSMTLLEVSELNECLKKRLNIADTPVMMAGAMPGASPASAEAEEEAPVHVQTSFTVKLNQYDEPKKISLIKEMKNCVDGMNLVQAKKFVESVPAVVRADISKDEAEKLKETLEKAGGICEIV